MTPRKPGLTLQIFIALAAGAIVGAIWPAHAQSLQVLATIFIRLVLVIIAPLIFSCLVVGIGSQSRMRELGSLALQAAGFFVVLTAGALALGMGLALMFRPGQGFAVNPAVPAEPVAQAAESFWVRIFPQSIADAMARGDVLQIVVFSVIFGVAVTLAGKAGHPVLRLCEALAQVMYKFTGVIMLAAPVGVFGATAALVGRQGMSAGLGFLSLIGAVYLGLALLLFVVFPMLLVIFRIPLRAFFQAIKEPFVLALATASASAALPRAMENMEKMGVPRPTAAFVMPTGLSLNPAGTTLFVGVATIFLLQAYGMPLADSAMMSLFGTLFVTSKGIAGVPRFGLVVTAAGLSSVGVSSDVVGAGIGLLLGIDPLLDMPRTAVNTTGNCLAAAVIARWQGTQLDSSTGGLSMQYPIADDEAGRDQS